MKKFLKKCESLGVINIQVDEPIAALDLTSEEKNALKSAYDRLSKATKINIHLATYFGDLRDNQPIIYGLPVQSIHLDQTRQGIDESIMAFPEDKVLSLGIVNGRNIWINDFDASIKTIKLATSIVGHERLIVASSCSLLHSPVTIQSETTLNQEIKQWLSFADEKVLEIKALSDLAMGDNSELLTQNQNAIANRRSSSLIHNESVKNRVAQIKSSDFNRKSHFEERQKGQQIKFDFPLFPTTTIGSFPQTTDVREARSKHKKGELSDQDYDQFLKDQIKSAVEFQESIGLDVLVHGEFERNDMVEYFGEQLSGFAFTQFGWVQSYGSRCVKPPIIYGDISREQPMTVSWSTYAQSLTEKKMKGMLTGPVTILQWSFVRDDQPRKDTTMQIALAIRDEVCDLESAGINL